MDFKFKLASTVLVVLGVILFFLIWQKDKTQQTYRNNKYGYEVIYPAEWKFIESNDLSGVQWTGQRGKGSGLLFGIGIRSNSQKKPVKDFLSEEDYFSGYRIVRDNITVSGQEAVKAKFIWEEHYPNETILFFNSPDNNYFFNVLGVEESILDGVMANFKFIK